MLDLAGALQAGTAAIGLLKELNEVNKEYDKATLKLKVAEVANSLLKLQTALGEAQSELSQKDAEIAKLKANFKQKQELVESDGYHYRKGADGKPRGRPYCPRCLDKGNLIMTVVTYKPGHPKQCPECKSEYPGVTAYSFE